MTYVDLIIEIRFLKLVLISSEIVKKVNRYFQQRLTDFFYITRSSSHTNRPLIRQSPSARG